MTDNPGDTQQASAQGLTALPDLKPCRQVGWIFRDGDCVAVERHGEELGVPARMVVD